MINLHRHTQNRAPIKLNVQRSIALAEDIITGRIYVVPNCKNLKNYASTQDILNLAQALVLLAKEYEAYSSIKNP